MQREQNEKLVCQAMLVWKEAYDRRIKENVADKYLRYCVYIYPTSWLTCQSCSGLLSFHQAVNETCVWGTSLFKACFFQMDRRNITIEEPTNRIDFVLKFSGDFISNWQITCFSQIIHWYVSAEAVSMMWVLVLTQRHGENICWIFTTFWLRF